MEKELEYVKIDRNWADLSTSLMIETIVNIS